MTPAAPFLFASIAEIGNRYRSGELSPVNVTEACLARIEALNPTLNAFLTVTADDALSSAAAAEAELRNGSDRGPLHGIPIALKDLVDTAGTRTTCGSRILCDHIPDQDAVIVRHLRAAGAVFLGKTNMLEFAYGIVHPDVGATWNPWNPARTAGGSSGGSAAAVSGGDVLRRRGHRHGWLHPRAGRILWCRRPEADVRSGQPAGNLPAFLVSGPRRPAGAHQRGRCAYAGRALWKTAGSDSRTRPGRHAVGVGRGPLRGR